MIDKADEQFYNIVKASKKISATSWGKGSKQELIFSWWLSRMTKKYPNILIPIIQSTYDRHLDILYLYELFIAQRNNVSLSKAISIAVMKRHTRHNINNIDNKHFNQETYITLDDNLI